MSEELKPVHCGCGGEAFHDTARGWNPVREDAFVLWHRVICKNCGTQTKAFYTEAEAIEAWNRAMGATDICVGDNERIAKVAKVDMPSERNKVYKCLNCGQYTHRTSWSSPVNYCTNCGARLEWNE